MFRCELIVDSNSNHLQQLYCGFALLAKERTIRLKHRIDRDSPRFEENRRRWFGAQSAGLRIILDGETRIYYDTGDSHDVVAEQLDWADIYFKRSYHGAIHRDVSAKIAPLDLNYMVKTNWPTVDSLRRAFVFSQGREKLGNLLRELYGLSLVSNSSRLKDLYAEPQRPSRFRLLFMCRLWEPTQGDVWQLTPEQVADREAINATRVACVRKLREEFGEDFLGGLAATDYAVEHFPDAVVDDPGLTHKKRYLELVKSCPVCVTTIGLAQSTGWKFAEYIALSRAVISEPLCAETAGVLRPGVHYFEFRSVDECVERAVQLRDDPDRMQAMMAANHDYYVKHLAPDKLVWSSLQRAQEMAGG